MKRFYRYIIYKLYTWSSNGSSSSTPVFNVIATLAVVHYCQLIFITATWFKFFPSGIKAATAINFIVAFFILFSIAHYYLFYNKKRWDGYVKEFEKETPKESLKGKIYVLSYLIGSTIGVIWLMYFINEYFFK